MHSKNPWFLALVVGLTALSLYLFSIRPFSYGLDVRGGLRFVFQMDESKLNADQKTHLQETQNRVKTILENRVSSALGVVEGSVITRGTDQFIVELPDQSDIESARKLLSTTAKIQVYWAKNVSTATRQRRYQPLNEQEKNGSPVVPFVKSTDSSKTLMPGDPEYKEMIDGWELILEGEDVAKAYGEPGGKGYQPHFDFSPSGASKLSTWSRRYANEGENMAFVLDGVVLNIAPLAQGAILSDNAYINGSFDASYVRKLSDLINSGSLPVSLTELASEKVDPTIGQKALGQMVLAGAISLAVISVFLIAYYSFPGAVATVAMLLYTLFTLTTLKLMGATFSLAAIAGFILSAGMAVDANILVFERVKEELRAGRKTMTAVELGFRRALTAIVDSNICTLLTSLVLWALGTGAVKGFATTLIVGVLISFFTAITVTRSLLVGITSLGWFTESKWYVPNRVLFKKLGDDTSDKPLKVIGKSTRYFVISGLLIVFGWIFVALGGIKLNVEFQGGFEAQYKITGKDISADTVRKNLEAAGLKGSNVKLASADADKWVYITLPEQGDLKVGSDTVIQEIADAAKVPNEGASIRQIGPAIQQETLNNAIMGVCIASALIVIYLAFRFGVALGGFKNGLKFGLSAVAALLHDVVFSLGVAGVVGFFLGWELSALFITALLTVIGFSVHDTIIIFDRMRENLKRAKSGETFEELVDMSIRQTLTRSIITSATAILPLFVLLFYGTPTPELKFMVLAMLTGIGVGTYSSIFNASPILFLWNKAIMKKRGEKFGLMEEALQENKIRASAALRTAGAAAPAGGGDAPVDSGYGTIKRKRSVKEQASVEIDEDDH